MKNKLAILLSLLIMAITNVKANEIHKEVTISETGAGSVQYINFDVLKAGDFDIQAMGLATKGTGYVNDPQIQLFSNSVTSMNWLAGDDDSGVDYDSWIANIHLLEGQYVLSASSYPLGISDAINAEKSAHPGLLHISISTLNGVVSSVPLPSAVWLFGSALIASLGVAKTRKQI